MVYLNKSWTAMVYVVFIMKFSFDLRWFHCTFAHTCTANLKTLLSAKEVSNHRTSPDIGEALERRLSGFKDIQVYPLLYHFIPELMGERPISYN